MPDMGIEPAPDPQYVPPPPSEVIEYPLDMSEDLELVVRQHIYRNMVVDFALMLDKVDTETGDRRHVFRVDCCHGTVHRHDFRRNKSLERDEPTILHEIDARPGRNPWQQVDEQFGIQYDLVLEQYEELYRRWAE